MNVLKGLVLSLFLVSSAVAADAGLESLVKTERAFAKMAGEKGTREAFLTYLAEDSVIFDPTPIPARPSYQNRQPSPALLSWDPSMADCSCDMGYTTGPWEWSPKAGEAPAAYGNFLSVWKRQKDGTWKVILDAGVENPKPDSPITPFSTAGRRLQQAGEFDVAKETAALLDADRRLSQISSTQGHAEALANVLIDSDDARLLHDQRQPLTGKDAILKYLKQTPVKLKWDTPKVGLSSCGDFGYTYGMLDFLGSSKPTQGVFMRIWRKVGNQWKVVVESLSPVPPGS